jgi:hypothetical protein
VDHVIFSVLDNTIYHALAEMGDSRVRDLARRYKYHIHRDLLVSPKSAQYVLFKSIKPLLQLAAVKGGAILAPLPRYLKEACCGDRDHMPNRNCDDFVSNLRSVWKAAVNNIRDFTFLCTLR